MTREKFTAMVEDAHRNKVLHVVGKFLTESEGLIDRFYNYVRKSDNEPETLAILKRLGIQLPEKRKPIIGYQIESANGSHEIPNGFYSFEVFSERKAQRWISNSGQPENWMIVPIYEGDIEDPAFTDL